MSVDEHGDLRCDYCGTDLEHENRTQCGLLAAEDFRDMRNGVWPPPHICRLCATAEQDRQF